MATDFTKAFWEISPRVSTSKWATGKPPHPGLLKVKPASHRGSGGEDLASIEGRSESYGALAVEQTSLQETARRTVFTWDPKTLGRGHKRV